MTSVFVSSTVYDLIDIRAEVQAHLVGMGLKTLLSDHPTSDFNKVPDANSIETCLINVRSSNHFVLILDQRYGPTLKDAGFDDVSATHLELRAAEAAKVPVYVYVRDRLQADFSVWKKQGHSADFQPVWAKDLALLRLLGDHGKLDASSRSNWYSTFRDSVDLKAQLSKDFKRPALAERLIMLTRSGQLPVVRPYYEGRNGNTFKFGAQVFEGVACAVQASLSSSGPWQPQGDITKGRPNFVVKHDVASVQFPVTFHLFVRYETVWGDAVEDCYAFIHGNSEAYTEQRMVSRRLLGEASYLAAPDERSA